MSTWPQCCSFCVFLNKFSLTLGHNYFSQIEICKEELGMEFIPVC